MEPVRASARDASGRFELTASLTRVGRDLVVVIGGGERPHVGSVVLAQPVPSRSRPGSWSASCSVVTIPPHKEEPLARRVAEELVAATGAVVVATAGVHDDGLDRDGIRTYLELGEELTATLCQQATERWGPPPPAPRR